MNNYQIEGFPPIIARSADLQPSRASLDELETSGAARNTYGVSVGDTVTFPKTLEECEFVKIPVRKDGGNQFVVSCQKNGKPDWFSLSNLRRLDSDMQPVHPVAEFIADEIREKALPQNDKTRLKLVLGKTITAAESVSFMRRIFGSDETEETTTAKLIFAK